MKDDRTTIAAWCTYDWANSAFTTLVVTFIYSTYFVQAFADDPDTGTAFWSRGIVVSSILIAVLSPVLGAAADRGGARRKFLIISTLVCVAATTVLAFITPDQSNAVLTALTVFVIANVAFEVGMVFYNAFLPAVVSPERIGRVSGYGWGLGYAGGLVCLVVALLVFVGLPGSDPLLALSTEDAFNVRATNLLVAGWFLIFSLPIFLWVRDSAKGASVSIGVPETGRSPLRQAFTDLKVTAQKIRHYRQLIRFLLARLVYNDGLVTVFAFAGIYASGTFDFTQSDIIVFGIVINVAAGLGAWVFGIMDDRRGGKSTIMVSLVALSVATLIAVLAPGRPWLWVAGIGIGIFAGPNQSASRSLMGRFVPERHQSEFFGFFAFSGKATAFLGPLLLGILSEAYGQRVGVSVVVLFFLAGGALLWTVDEKEGIEAAKG
ncbi:MAG: MFS transporter [Vicinamibacterales bacterium]|nr:MFS transporter [Vicinamibacterales bacterium]